MRALLIISFILVRAGFAFAQNYSGRVINFSGAPVEGVFVSVGHSEFYTRTNVNGEFEIKNATLSAGFKRPQQSKGQQISARWNFRRRTLDLSGAPGVTSASIYSLNGKRVVNGKVPPSKIIPLPSLSMGVYLLELKGDGGTSLRGRVVLSNKNSSFTFRSMNSKGGRPLSVSESSLASETGANLLIFRHDKYFPVDTVISGSQSGMFIFIEEDPRNVVFDQTKVHEYRFTISSADSLDMYLNGYNMEYKQAAMEYNGASMGGVVGLRYKGSSYTLPRCFNFDYITGKPKGPRTCEKISFKVKFTEYDKNKRFHAMKRINLHSMNADPTKMHDMLAYELFREMGIHAPRTSYANVYVNDTHIGLFAAVEQIDGRFTKSRWPGSKRGDGNLYKEVWPDVSQSYRGDEKYYIDGLKTNDNPEDNPQARRMVEFYNAIAASNEQNFKQNLSQFMDFDHFLRYMAVDVAINNWDGIRGWYSDGAWAGNHNFFFYEEEENNGGKIWLVPWDMDQTLQERCNYFEPPNGVPNWNVITSSCAGVPAGFGNYIRPPSCDKLTGMMSKLFWDRFKQLGEQFLQDQFQSQRLRDKMERYSKLISSYVDADKTIGKFDWENDAARMNGYLPNLSVKFSNHLNSSSSGGGGGDTGENLTSNPNGMYLSTAHLNDFELTSAGNLKDWAKGYVSDNSTVSVTLNTSSPISGSADLRFDFTFNATDDPKPWDVWCNFQPEFAAPVDFSNLKEIRLNAAADMPRTIRVSLGSYELYTANGVTAEYGWDGINVTAQSKEVVLSMQYLDYPSWAPVQPNIKDELIKSVKTLMFLFSGRYSDSAGLMLIDNDTGHLQVDNIRFIYNK
jgi:hypothetical protein